VSDQQEDRRAGEIVFKKNLLASCSNLAGGARNARVQGRVYSEDSQEDKRIGEVFFKKTLLVSLPPV
jgi:hypothetical protein